jgi:(p)ppGpp synthase/HD superfamily hydrolase
VKRRNMRTDFDGLPKAHAAVAYAKRAHEGQRRQSDGALFVVHPLEVATLLYYAGSPDHLIAAGVLHDTIEKTDTAPTELHELFGPEVETLVLAVTEDARIKGYTKRKAALREQVARAGDEALMLFAADKVSKVRELRLPRPGAAARWGVRTAGGAVLRRRKLNHYRECLELLEHELPGAPLVVQLRGELDALPADIVREPVFAATG